MRILHSFVVVLVLATPALAQMPAPAPAPASAQAAQPQRAPRPGEVELPPIQCWWKTGTSEIRIGQQFPVTLTCGVVETSALTVVAGTNQLDPGALQLTPFEVVSGVRHDDIVAPPFRYFQYEYRMRLLSEGFFGQDVTIPALTVTYNIQAAAGRGAQGRDQNYVLPALPLRVASLVPRNAADIREPMGQSFESVETRRARASTASVIGGLLMAFAGLLGVLALVRVFGRVRQRRPDAARPIAPVTVLGGCLRALTTVKADVQRDGWSPALAQRTLTALRVASAVALGRPMAQAPATSDQKVRDGQLVIRHGLLRPRRAVISAAVTPHTIQRELSGGAAVSAASRAALEQLRKGLQTLGAAAYGREETLDTIALDSALADGTSAVKQLRARSLRPMGGIARTPPQTSLETLAAERT
jgi:hypothetical protein